MRKTPPHLPGLDFLGLLGSGGYADVFLYEQHAPRMKVAVKVLTEELSHNALRQFTAEGNAMAHLADHPHIVQVFRADTAPDGRPYLVMKYFPMPNLAVKAKEGRFTLPEVLRIGIQVCGAVETAHRAGILHRDIKPANILTGQFGALGLTDFGIAATKAEVAGGEMDGVSIPWAAPEILVDPQTADERSRRVAAGWRELVDRALDMGATVPRGRTRREHGHLLQNYGIAPLARSADSVIFGPIAPSDEDSTQYWAAVDEARQSMVSDLGRWERFRVAVSLASLRRRREPVPPVSRPEGKVRRELAKTGQGGRTAR